MKTGFLYHTLAFRLKACWCYVFAGNGIYAPDGPREYYYNTETENGHLLVTEPSSHPRLSPDYPAAVNWKLYASSIEQLPSNSRCFSGVIYHDLFSFTELAEPEGDRAICQQDLCCHLGYKTAEKQKDDIYVLGAFDGLQVVEGEYSCCLDSGKAGIISLQPVCIYLFFWLRGFKRRHFLGPPENNCFLFDAF